MEKIPLLTKNEVSTINKSHGEILSDCQFEIETLFIDSGAITPNITELYPANKWQYCRTENNKDRGKIGYRCEFLHAGNRPFVKITVHSFKNGGETFVFNSLYSKETDVLTSKKTIPLNVLQKQRQNHSKQLSDEKKKKLRYEALLKEWEVGSQQVDDHPYVIRKRITHTLPLRLVSNNGLAYQIRTIDNTVCGIQVIYPEGDKRIHGKKNGGFAVLGNLEACILYLCEGYATANAVFELAKLRQKKDFAVIICLDCHNLVSITRLLKQKYPHKKLVICPDNDQKTAEKGHGNPGLMAGLGAALNTRSDIKIPDALYGSDWCDSWIGNAQKAAEGFYQKINLDLEKRVMMYLRQFKNNAEGHTITKAIYTALSFLKNKYIIDLSEEEMISKVTDALKHTNVNRKQVKKIWSRVKHRLFASAMRTRTFSQITSKNIIEGDTLDDLIEIERKLKKQYPKAVFITNAKMGAGKTKIFMQPNFSEDESNGLLPMVITPTRSLTHGVSQRFDSAHYQNDVELLNKKDALPTSFSITINSVINPRYYEYLTYCQALYIDEFTQVLRAITSGTVEHHLKQHTEDTLARLIKNVNYLYIADADFNQIAMDYLESILPDKTPVFILKVKEKSEQLTYKIHHYQNTNTGPAAIRETIKEALKQQKKLYITTDSKSQIERIKKQLKHLKCSILDINSNTLQFKEQRMFLEQPDNYLKTHQPDVVIVSPAIQSGISIELDYFDEVFGIYTGTVVPAVFQQMLHRVRSQKVFHLVLPSYRGSRPKELENATALLTAAYQQHMSQFGYEQAYYDPKTKQHHIGKLSIQSEEGRVVIKGDDHYLRYETLNAELTALDNEQRHNAASYFILQAEARGIHLDVIRYSLTNHQKKEIHLRDKTDKLILEKERQQQLSGKNCLSDSELQKLKKEGAETLEESIFLERHEIASTLKIRYVTHEDVAFFDKNGVTHLTNYNLLMEGENHAHRLDDRDRTKGVAKTNAKWRKPKAKLLTILFNFLGIHKETGKGSYTDEEAKQVRLEISSDEAISRFILFKLKLQVNSALSHVAFVNKMLKKLVGLNIMRMQQRTGQERYWIYCIAEDSFKQLRKYYELSRQSIPVPFLMAA